MLYQLSYASPHRLFPAHTAASPGERPFKRKISTAFEPSQRSEGEPWAMRCYVEIFVTFQPLYSR